MTKSTSTEPGAEEKGPSFYVAIGASAGGLEALDAFFSHTPPQSGLAFIVIQHLSPDYKSLMVELLQKRTEMKVCRAEEGMAVEANKVYLIPPKKELRIFHGKLLLKDMDYTHGINLPIDVFFRSLAEDQGEKAAGVILSGTGSDGVRGVRAIKEAGGVVVVQDEDSARFDGMPRAALQTGLADLVVPPEQMPERLVRILSKVPGTHGEGPALLPSDEGGLMRIFALLREHGKLDFTHYKPSTVLRRIERRMTVNQIETLHDYVEYLEQHPGEVNRLFRELLIGVTNFFRDPEVFRELEENHLPRLLRQSGGTFRVWVAGCSTGEEAYSIGMMLRECMERENIKREIKIFATDVDREAVQFAGNGIYPESIAVDMPRHLLGKYFLREHDHYRVKRFLRESVVFAQHNLIKDPPFTNINLASCRNLLIYLQPILQKKVLENINFALRPQGIMLMGTSETPGKMGDFFTPLHQKYKIYESKGRRQTRNDGQVGEFDINSLTRPLSVHSASGHSRLEQTERRMLERALETVAREYSSVVLIVNERLEVLHIAGEPEQYLQWRSGKMMNDITKMVSTDLAIPLSTGLQKVFSSGEEVVYSNVRLRRKGREEVLVARVRLRMLKSRKGQEALVAVIFEETVPRIEVDGEKSVHDYDLTQETEQRINDLEQELQFNRENLQATIEELETSNEELQASNEELLASNEELQSTNEELQSVNEELHTVNAEYHGKITELTEMTNDLNNLMAATGIPTIFLDENLEIRRFTPEATELFHILPSDIGRSIEHITHKLQSFSAAPLLQAVERHDEGKSIEVETVEGRHFLLHAHPYRVGRAAISGMVITFVNIDAIKQAENQLREEREQLFSIFESIDQIIYVADMDTHEILFANRKMRTEFGDDLVGKKCYECVQQRPEPCDFCTNEIIRQNEDAPYEWEHYNPVTERTYHVLDRVIQWTDGRRVRFEMAIDVTKLRRVEKQHLQALNLLNEAQRLTRLGGWEWDVERQRMFWSDECYRLHGLEPGSVHPGSEEHIARSLECYPSEDRERVSRAFRECCEMGRGYDLEVDFTDFNGKRRRIRTRAEAVKQDGKIVKVIGNIMDITDE
jgi:two-component system CheB/CheR fusion protein